MMVSRSQHPNVWLLQPFFHGANRFLRRAAKSRQAWIGYNSEKCSERLPGQAYRLGSRKNFFQPLPSFHVMGRSCAVRVKENVCIQNFQRRSGPSNASSSSSTLSKLMPGGGPSFHGLATKRFRAGCFEAINPRRRKRFTICLNGSPDLRASWFNRLATSSSRVRVVCTSRCYCDRHHDVKTSLYSRVHDRMINLVRGHPL